MSLYERGTRIVIGHHHCRIDVRVLERLFEAHAEQLLGFLLLRTGDLPLAEDLVADTFERALRARLRFDRRRASEKTWLYAIALNCLRDRRRRDAAEEAALQRSRDHMPGDDADDETQHIENRDVVERGLRSLTSEEREAVALRYGADLTIPEIARLAKMNEATARGRVYRALEKLRNELDATPGGVAQDSS